MLRAGLVACIFGGVFLAAGGAARLRAAQCDPDLLRAPDNANGYRERGGRCEGVYMNPVSSTALLLASLTESFPDGEPGSAESLLLEWSAPKGAGEVHLRANSLRRRMYYRMDAVRPAAGRSFRWPMDIVAALRMSPSDLGLVAFVPGLSGDAARTVYYPLRVSGAGRAGHSSGYQAIVLPGVEFAELYLSLALEENGGRRKFLIDGRPLRYGYYPADRAVRIPLPGIERPGVYYLQVGGTLKSGGAANLETWFYCGWK